MTCLNLFEWTDFLVLRNAIFDIHDYNQYVLDFLFWIFCESHTIHLFNNIARSVPDNQGPMFKAREGIVSLVSWHRAGCVW